MIQGTMIDNTTKENQLFNNGFRAVIKANGAANTPYSDLKNYINSLIDNGIFKEDSVYFSDNDQKIYFKYGFNEMTPLLNSNNNTIVYVKNPGRNTDTLMPGLWVLNNLQQQSREAALIADANNFFNGISPDFMKVSNIIPSNIPLTEQNQELILSKLLSKNNGIPFGESHNHEAPKQFLINHAEKLKSLGVEYIFLEHFTEQMQPSLDYFFKTGKMPKDLSCWVKYLDKGFKLSQKQYTFESLLIEMQKAGIRPIAIESAYSYAIPGDLSGNSKKRMLAMNYQFKQNLNKILKEDPQAKWVALVGYCHLTTHNNVPGIAEMCECPGVAIMETDSQQEIKLNYQELDSAQRDAVNAQVLLNLRVEDNKFKAIKKINHPKTTVIKPKQTQNETPVEESLAQWLKLLQNNNLQVPVDPKKNILQQFFNPDIVKANRNLAILNNNKKPIKQIKKTPLNDVLGNKPKCNNTIIKANNKCIVKLKMDKKPKKHVQILDLDAEQGKRLQEVRNQLRNEGFTECPKRQDGEQPLKSYLFEQFNENHKNHVNMKGNNIIEYFKHTRRFN